MRLAIKEIIPAYSFQRDFTDAIKDNMLKRMGADLLMRYKDFVTQRPTFNGDVELYFEIDVLALGELEAIERSNKAKIERAIEAAKPKIVDDYGNEI